ncbi:MAG: valine--tRNA ligase [Acidimicrobiales bacterium]
MVTPRVPERPSLDGLEAKWAAYWGAEGTYRFDRSKERGEVYSIDAPPPTVSGSLHTGHLFSYAHTDMTARFRRMRGKAVFYPVGWDDNGLATERRVQNYYGVRCDPTQPFDPGFEPPAKPSEPAVPISRPNFVELCRILVSEDERVFEETFKRLGYSYDWTTQYTTIGENSRRTSQAAFLKMVERGEAYRAEAPTLWDVDFRTAVAQAELEDREVPGAYHRIAFARAGAAGAVEIETTRPELIAACVALVAHPTDARYQSLFGSDVLTPLFRVRVPVLAHHLADPEKGSGIAMICTFGDTTDVTWWRELSLPARTIMERDGRLGAAPFGEPGWESDDVAAARASYAELEGKNVKQAQRRIVEMLRESGDLVGEPRPVSHAVKFYERGERPLEIVSSQQWYVRTMSMRERLTQAGRDIEWHPEFMRMRYEAWVEGLTGDWSISRQRYFGVPFPVWYQLDEQAEVVPGGLILADAGALPVDPSTDAPPGYGQDQRGAPLGFAGDPDVMDTWATSSLTPQIAGHWLDDPDLFSRVYPMDLRPQAHDIIRTWLFATVVRSELEHGQLPWRHAAISGWILDPDRKKMSKSKGNVVVPIEPLDRHGSDAARYWAGSARLGVDTAYDEQQMTVGRRLAIKILNASKFVLSRMHDGGEMPAGSVTEAVDVAMLSCLSTVVAAATDAFESYDHARALELVETFFWTFCDDYLELVKARAYGEASTQNGAKSASVALETALSVLLRCFAPFLPFCTEEAWSWWHDGSIHLQPWPAVSELAAGGGGQPVLLAVVSEALGLIRRAKSEAHRSMRAPVVRCSIAGPASAVALLELAAADLARAGTIAELVFVAGGDGEDLTLQLELAEQRASGT